MQNDMRDRLVELLDEEYVFAEDIADKILADGWIRLPCKVGDDIYRVVRGKIWEWQIAMAYMYLDEIIFVDDSENEFTEKDIGKTVFLTKDQAEQKLKEMRVENDHK